MHSYSTVYNINAKQNVMCKMSNTNQKQQLNGNCTFDQKV